VIASTPRVHRGMSLAEAQQACRDIGGMVEEGHHGGELRFSHPLVARRQVVHSQRPDAPITLVAWLNSIARTIHDLNKIVDELVEVAAARLA
jgi:hypothetical protein